MRRVAYRARVAQVLLVEDDPMIRSALLRGLGERGHAVDSAPTALAGLERAMSARPDLVVLDPTTPTRPAPAPRVDDRGQHDAGDDHGGGRARARDDRGDDDHSADDHGGRHGGDDSGHGGRH